MLNCILNGLIRMRNAVYPSKYYLLLSMLLCILSSLISLIIAENFMENKDENPLVANICEK